MLVSRVGTSGPSLSFTNAMQAPTGKRLKTQVLTRHTVAISSRIREVRENLCRIYEGSELQLESLEVMFVSIHLPVVRLKIREVRRRSAIAVPVVRFSSVHTEGP
jgi:hypothetical protein